MYSSNIRIKLNTRLISININNVNLYNVFEDLVSFRTSYSIVLYCEVHIEQFILLYERLVNLIIKINLIHNKIVYLSV